MKNSHVISGFVQFTLKFGNRRGGRVDWIGSSRGHGGMHENKISMTPLDSRRFAWREAGYKLGLSGRSKAQRTITIEDKAKLRTSMNTKTGGDTQKKATKTGGSQSLMPAGFFPSKNSRKQRCPQRSPKPQRADPGPPVEREP